jgi:hypothetical protein
MQDTDFSNAVKALKKFDKDAIQRLVPILERAHSQVVEYSNSHDKKTVQLKTEEGKRYWISPEGVNVVAWSPDAIVGGCLFPMHTIHREYGMTPSKFVEKYVTDLDEAREIARNLNVSL